MWVKTLYPQWTSRLLVIPYTTWLVGFDPYPYEEIIYQGLELEPTKIFESCLVTNCHRGKFQSQALGVEALGLSSLELLLESASWESMSGWWYVFKKKKQVSLLSSSSSYYVLLHQNYSYCSSYIFFFIFITSLPAGIPSCLSNCSKMHTASGAVAHPLPGTSTLLDLLLGPLPFPVAWIPIVGFLTPNRQQTNIISGLTLFFMNSLK